MDDIEDEWAYSVLYDYIHGRWIYSCFGNASSIIEKLYNGLARGGCLELQDLIFPLKESCGNNALGELVQYVVTGSTELGKDFQSVKDYPSIMKDVGFEEIHSVHFPLPIRRLEDELYALARSISIRLGHSLLNVESMIDNAQSILMDGRTQVEVKM